MVRLVRQRHDGFLIRQQVTSPREERDVTELSFFYVRMFSTNPAQLEVKHVTECADFPTGKKDNVKIPDPRLIVNKARANFAVMEDKFDAAFLDKICSKWGTK